MKNLRRITIALLLVVVALPVQALSPSSRIREEILNQVKADASFVNYDITVDVRQGEVTLSGQVPSEANRQALLNYAKRTEGVRSVNNMLTVRGVSAPPQITRKMNVTEESLSDQEIVARVEKALRQSGQASLDGLRLTSQAGIVRLEGDLPSHRAVDQALAVVLMVPGVKDVRSDVSVSGKPYPRSY